MGIRNGSPSCRLGDMSAASSLEAALQRRVAHTVELGAVEIRYATISALGMLMLLIVASAAVVIGWGLLVAALIAALIAAGFAWPAVTLGLAAVHALAAGVCWQLVMRLSRNLSLPALRAALREQVSSDS